MSKSKQAPEEQDVPEDSESEKRTFPSGRNLYHTGACSTVRRNANSFSDLREVTEVEIENKGMEKCTNCEQNNAPQNTPDRINEENSAKLQRVTVRVPIKHIKELETMTEEDDLNNRCEGIREAIRQYLS